MIPKIIHRCWLGPNSPDPYFVEAHDRWAALNPGWQVHDWNDDNVEQALLPLMYLRDDYLAAPTYVHRVDIAIVEAVRVYGGVAVAWDSEPLKPIEPFYRDSKGWCSPDGDLIPGGAFFGAEPDHPGTRAILQAIKHRIERYGWTRPVNEITGPFAWMDAFGVEIIGDPATRFPLEILGRREDFYPVTSNERHHQHLTYGQMVERARAVDAVAVHMYSRSWLAGGLDVTVR